MANKLDNVLFQRLQDRARIISTTPSEEMPDLEYVLAQAQYLGKLLHTARQLFERPTFTTATLENRRDEETMTTPFPTDETLWLWEQGLMLPDEVTSGQVSAVVRSYVDSIHKQRGPDPAYRLKQDIVSLYSALKEGHAMSDLFSLEMREER